MPGLALCYGVSRVSFRAALLAFAFASLVASPAAAFCQGSTCDNVNCPLDDDGCKTTGRPVAWRNGVVGMSLQRDGTGQIDIDDVRDALTAALATWTLVSCDDGTASIGFVELKDAACNRPEANADGPNANVIMFTDMQRASSGKRSGTIDANTLGLTTRTYDANTGEIVGADIQINTADADFGVAMETDKYDLQSVLTHELGHVIGLDHWPDPNAVMFGQFSSGETRRDLTDDEIDAACTIYPPGRKVTGDGAGTPLNGFSSACHTTTVSAEAPPDATACGVGRAGSPTFGAGMAAFLAALALRRRR